MDRIQADRICCKTGRRLATDLSSAEVNPSVASSWAVTSRPSDRRDRAELYEPRAQPQIPRRPHLMLPGCAPVKMKKDFLMRISFRAAGWNPNDQLPVLQFSSVHGCNLTGIPGCQLIFRSCRSRDF